VQEPLKLLIPSVLLHRNLLA